MMQFAKECVIVSYVYFLMKQGPREIYIMRGTTMKKTLKPILSLLLAFAMLLPMAVTVRADDAITVTGGGQLVLPTAGHTHTPSSLTLTATLPSNTPSGGTWEWSAVSELTVISSDNTATVSLASNATAQAYTVTANYTYTPSGGSQTTLLSGTATVTAVEDSISVSPANNSVQVAVGGTASAGVTASYACGQSDSILYSGYDSNIIAVDASTGSIRGIAAGSTTITATSTSDSTKSASVTVTVTDPTPTIATGVSVTPSSAKIYTTSANNYSAGSATKRVNLLATAVPANYSGGITWSMESSNSVVSSLTVSGQLDYSTNKENQLTVNSSSGSGTVTVTASLDTASGIVSDACVITVEQDAFKEISLTAPSSSVAVGSNMALSAKAIYNSQSEDTGHFGFVSDNTAIATVDSYGRVTGVAPGTATIYAYYYNGTGDTKPESITITVTGPARVTATDKMAVNGTKTLADIYSTLRVKFQGAYGDYPSANATITLGDLSGKTPIGMLYTGSNVPALSNTPYLLSGLSSFYLVSTGKGDFTFTANITDGARTLNADITITVSVATANVRIPISGSSDYSFDQKADGGKTGYELIESALSGTGYQSITFGTPTSSAAIGTLYASSASSSGKVDGTTVNKSSLANLYFIPGSKSSGVYHIPFTAWSQAGGRSAQGSYQVADGELTIAVNLSSLDVDVLLDKVEPYTFSSAPSTGTTTASSAYTKLTEVIDAVLGTTSWSISFDDPGSGAIGKLYRTKSSTTTLTSSTKTPRASLGELYFVPSELGTFSVSFSVYASSSVTPDATGTLTLNVATLLGDADFQYSVAFGKSVTLDEDDFAAFVSDKIGSSYTLSRVTFNGYSGKGSFYYNGKTFTPGGSTDYYATTYDGRVPSGARYIEDVSFTAPSSNASYTAVSFTAYAASGSTTRSAVGVFYIFYSGEIPVISYDVYGSTGFALKESDFVRVYKSAMNSTASNPQFRIRLQSVPGTGYLTQTSSTSSRNNTQLTVRNVSSSYYTIGATSSTRSISNVVYTPLSFGVDTTDKVTYIAYSTNDTPLFTGEIRFLNITPRNATVSSEGLDFSANDFYLASDSDPVLYVTFNTPASGKLYVTSSSGLVRITESTKLYTLNTSDGTYPVGETHYIPMAGQSTPVTLTYTAHTKSGSTYNNTIVVSPTSKTVSAKFTDVSGDIGRWAANSVDFASKYGFVQGTVAGGSTFDPTSTMRRCDLVLILYRMSGSPVVSGTMPYSDVPRGTTSYSIEIYNSALWASQRGIMDGLVSDGKYLPTTNITRQDYVRILYNYTKAQGISVTSSASLAGYADASSVASYATAAMAWAVANNYVTSTETGRLMLSPDRQASRAEIVTLLHRYLTY